MSGGHAYTTLGAAKPKDAQGNELKLVKVRNPHGKSTYKGPWHDADTRWTDALKTELGWTAANDGIFWMDIKTYKEEHTDTSVNEDV